MPLPTVVTTPVIDMCNFQQANWLFQPKHFEVSKDNVSITTEPGTDLWQRTYYGFRSDKAPMLLLESQENFTLTVKASFDFRTRFDQCGVVVYLDSDNWFKASIEYENQAHSRLGSVVTNHGHSDWATQDIDSATGAWYRLSRRGPDFLIEHSADGSTFSQMRIFHLHLLGETTALMGKADPPLHPTDSVAFGLYACSPLESSFQAKFTKMSLTPCHWPAHQA